MNAHFTRWPLFLILLFLSGLIGEAQALQVVYPADGTYVIKSNYLIIKGGRDPFLDGMSVEINGVKSDIIDLTGEKYRAIFADMLLLEPIFDPGENKVTVEGYLHGEMLESAEVTIFYQNDIRKPTPVGFSKEVFHLVEREAPCRECHDMQPTEAAANDPRPEHNPCASCHKRMLNELHVHGPAGAFQCLYCHDRESSPIRYQAKTGDALVCNECHEKNVQGFNNQEAVHGPVDAGMCLICHDPHASEQPLQLVEKVNSLCLSCHERVLKAPHVTSGTSERSHPMEGSENPRDKKQPFNCSSCHDPHGGKHENYFIAGVSARMQLCRECHRK